MGIEQIQEFLSAPQIPDIISYVLIIVAFILQAFVKKFVKKDNIQTLFKVDAKTEKLENVRAELNESKEAMRTERELYEAEKKKLEEEVALVRSELNSIKKVIRIGFGNVESLVKSGMANNIAKLLPLETDEEDKTDIPTEAREEKESEL